MTELSPAAQAVLFAWDDVVGRRGDPTPTEQRALAAALRAAATILRDAYANEEYVDPADDWLDAIAAELDAP